MACRRCSTSHPRADGGVLGERRDMIAERGPPPARVMTTSARRRWSASCWGARQMSREQLEQGACARRRGAAHRPGLYVGARAAGRSTSSPRFRQEGALSLLLSRSNAARRTPRRTSRVSLSGFSCVGTLRRNSTRRAHHHSRLLGARPPDTCPKENLLDGSTCSNVVQGSDRRAAGDDPIQSGSLPRVPQPQLAQSVPDRELDAAIQPAERQIQRSRKVLWAYGQLATGYSPKATCDSETSSRKALELDARFTDDWSRLGHVLRLQGRHEEARHAYLRVLEINPKDISAQFRGWSHLATDRR